MQSAQYALLRLRVIILYKCDFVSNGFFNLLVIETLKEEATLVFEHNWPNDFDIRNFSVSDLLVLTL